VKTEAIIESIKTYVREAIIAFQEGAGSQDAPFTADLTIAAIWRHIDLVVDDQLEAVTRLRIEAPQGQRIDVIATLATMNPETVTQVGGRAEGDNDVWYVWIPTKTVTEAMTAIVALKKDGADVRDWQYYEPA